MDKLRNLKPADFIFTESLYFSLGQFDAVGSDHKSCRLFAIFFRRTTDDRHIPYARHRTDKVFDFLWRNIFAAANDEVFKATSNVIVAFGIHAANIA